MASLTNKTALVTGASRGIGRATARALANAGAPGTITPDDTAHLIPLVIQDKTFVPTPAEIGMTDPTWAAFGTNPGTAVTGDLWFPHVYMPNQDPNDPLGGASARRAR